MAEVDLHLENLTIPELIAAGARVADGLANNAHFPDPKPSAAELEQLVQKLTATHEEHRAHQTSLIDPNAARDALVHELKAALTQIAAYVQEASGGDVQKILSANLHFEHGRSFWPFGSLEQVRDVAARTGDEPGVINLFWDPVHRAAGYEVEISRDAGPYGPWEPVAATRQAKTTLEQLTHKQRYWIRVRAVTEDKTGEWSDPVAKVAP